MSRSRSTSCFFPGAFATMLVAFVEKTTKRPVALSTASMLSPLPAVMLVVTSVSRLRTKMLQTGWHSS